MIDVEPYDSDEYVLSMQDERSMGKHGTPLPRRRRTPIFHAIKFDPDVEEVKTGYEYPILKNYVGILNGIHRFVVETLIETHGTELIRRELLRSTTKEERESGLRGKSGEAERVACGFTFETLASNLISQIFAERGQTVFGPSSTTELFTAIYDKSNIVPDDLIISPDSDALAINHVLEYKMNPKNQHMDLSHQILRISRFLNKYRGQTLAFDTPINIARHKRSIDRVSFSSSAQIFIVSPAHRDVNLGLQKIPNVHSVQTPFDAGFVREVARRVMWDEHARKPLF